MVRKVELVIYEMLDAILGIEDATRGLTFQQVQQAWILRHGVQRGIEIISEASRRLPADLLSSRPEVPWPTLRAIGNVLRHEYHNIADEVLWGVVKRDLPVLKAALVAMQADIDNAKS